MDYKLINSFWRVVEVVIGLQGFIDFFNNIEKELLRV